VSDQVVAQNAGVRIPRACRGRPGSVQYRPRLLQREGGSVPPDRCSVPSPRNGRRPV